MVRVEKLYRLNQGRVIRKGKKICQYNILLYFNVDEEAPKITSQISIVEMHLLLCAIIAEKKRTTIKDLKRVTSRDNNTKMQTE